MARITVAMLGFMICLVAGCANSPRLFTNLGDDGSGVSVGVPVSAVEEYAQTNDVTLKEARSRMLADAIDRRQADE